MKSKSKIESIVTLGEWLVLVVGSTATAFAATNGYDWKVIVWAMLVAWATYHVWVIAFAEFVGWLSHRKKEA